MLFFFSKELKLH